MPTNSTGNCYLCGAVLGKAAIKNHLIKIHGEEKDGQECCLLKIEGEFNKGYWLYIDVPAGETLDAIDFFLRKIWLECCGHMSAFFLPKRNELNMNRKLKTFEVGTNLSHHYDFGTTTETVITFMGAIRRKPQKGAVRLLARNVPPVFKCADCGETAAYIDTELMYQSNNPFYCKKCRKRGDEDILLPITNSPRMGECAYSGEDDTFAFNPASIADGPK
jgi:hypothetical protein